MTGWMIFAVVVVAGAALFALAWWSAGRQKPLGRRGGDTTQTEKDYLAGGSARSAGNQGSFLT